MKDKLNIKVKLADVAPLGMVVSFEGEEEVRLAERYVNRVWSKWMESKPADKTSKDVLGMVALHFAKLYVIEQRKNERIDDTLRDFEEKLDDILLNIE